MYPRSFLCEEAKIKQRTPLKKELCKIDEEAIWESRFTSFFYMQLRKLFRYLSFSSIIFFRTSIIAGLPHKHEKGGRGQNLEDVERTIFRNLKIANIKMTKDELFDSFIIDFLIFFINYLNNQNI